MLAVFVNAVVVLLGGVLGTAKIEVHEGVMGTLQGRKGKQVAHQAEREDDPTGANDGDFRGAGGGFGDGHE